ncbi:hypothetical protein D0809_05965 [Flavobacterium circumlabens]|uniref:Uncharacterized protein n=1 Tax=Flavobacterium circumlabens TaxID=2133765 RepID=A0A4Y7UEG0_9FLAO|nr:hypothetical protein D0809_05965 [Flavobacterium circumlabens]
MYAYPIKAAEKIISIFRIIFDFDEYNKIKLIKGLIKSCDKKVIHNKKGPKFKWVKSLFIIFLKEVVRPQVLHLIPSSA